MKEDYWEGASHEKTYLDLRASPGYSTEPEKLERKDSKITLYGLLKAAAAEKLNLRVWAHFVRGYLYILSRTGLTLGHRTYAINQEDKDLLE